MVGRLRGMPAAEIPHRLRESWRRAADRRGARERLLGELPADLLASEPPSWPLALERLPPRLDGALSRQLEGLLHGRFELLGVARPAESRRDWHLDPASGRRWPAEVHGHDIDFRTGDGDAKLAWELGRLQHLQLAAAAALCGRDDPAWTEDLADWIAHNPPYSGLAWAAGIEVAARVVSILVATAAWGSGYPEELRAAVWRTLAAHGAWLARYPSLHSSANNHRVAELGGLFALGCLAPALPGADAWREEGAAGLAEEAPRQILDDGAGSEQSPSYQAYSLEWMAVAVALGRATGHPLDPLVEERLALGAGFLVELLDDGGEPFRFGDDDEGVVLRQTLGRDAHVASVCAAIGGLLGRPEVVPPGRTTDLRAALLGVEVPASTFTPRSRGFPAGGYTLLRRGRATLLFDHGALGHGTLGAHGHADALSVWLRLDGRPVLIDAGTFRYNGAPDWRRFFRGTAAHNTLTVDDRPSSRPLGDFGWASKARARCTGRDLPAGRVAGAHDGFRALGVTHHRGLELDERHLLVADRLEGSGRHRVAVRWLFAPHLAVEPADEGWRVSREGVLLAVLCSAGLEGRVERQAERPAPGICSPAYNRLSPAAALCFEGELELPCTLSTELFFGLAAPGGRLGHDDKE